MVEVGASEGYKSRVYITKAAVNRIIHPETEALSPFAFVDAYGSENQICFAHSIIPWSRVRRCARDYHLDCGNSPFGEEKMVR